MAGSMGGNGLPEGWVPRRTATPATRTSHGEGLAGKAGQRTTLSSQPRDASVPLSCRGSALFLRWLNRWAGTCYRAVSTVQNCYIAAQYLGRYSPIKFALNIDFHNNSVTSEDLVHCKKGSILQAEGNRKRRDRNEVLQNETRCVGRRCCHAGHAGPCCAFARQKVWPPALRLGASPVEPRRGSPPGLRFRSRPVPMDIHHQLQYFPRRLAGLSRVNVPVKK